MVRQARLRLRQPAPVFLLAFPRRAAARRGLLRQHHFLQRSLPRRRYGGFRIFLEERVAAERFLHLLRELERRHLQKPQRLLDLRGEGEVLAQT
jgi:hypothetical protein